MKKLKYLLPLALFIVLAGFLVKGLYLDPHEVPSPLIGKPAPAFQLQDQFHQHRHLQHSQPLLSQMFLSTSPQDNRSPSY